MTMKTNLRASRVMVIASLLVAGGLLLPVMASATPISFYNDASAPATSVFTLGCGSATGDCSGQLEAVFSDSPLEWNSSIGQMFKIKPANPNVEMAFVNGLLGTTFAANSGNVVPGNLTQFQLNAEYFLIKVGGGSSKLAFALLHNLGGNLDLYLTATPGQGGGLSHYVTFGTAQVPPPVPVPEPGVLGMFGLGALLAGLFAGSRRRFS